MADDSSTLTTLPLHVEDSPTQKKTVVINLMAGAGAGKTVVAAFLFYRLKIAGYVCEYVQELAKKLVWLKEFDILNNQYYVSSEQYKMLKALNGVVDVIITDGPLLHGLYYNRFNDENTSNIDKTEASILKWHQEFININIFVERGSHAYESAGRYQTEAAARQIDTVLLHLLDRAKIDYTSLSTEKHELIFETVQTLLKQHL